VSDKKQIKKTNVLALKWYILVSVINPKSNGGADDAPSFALQSVTRFKSITLFNFICVSYFL